MQQALQKACKSAIVGDSKSITFVRDVALVLAQAPPPHKMTWADIKQQLSVKPVSPYASNLQACQYLEVEVLPNVPSRVSTVRLQVDALSKATKPDPSSSPVMDVINAQLAQACSIIVDDEVADIIMQMAELLAASGPPYQLSWKDMRAHLEFDLIKGLVKEVSLFKYFKVGDSPDGHYPRTVQLLVDKVAADAVEAGLRNPAQANTQASEDPATIFNLLPPSVKSACAGLGVLDLLMEVVLDLGRPPVLKFQGAKPMVLKDVGPVDLQEAVDCLVAAHKLNRTRSKNSTWLSDMDLDVDLIELSSFTELPLHSDASTAQPATAPHGLFGPDNRLGIPGTLHRISAIRARDGSITGLTYRVGRHLPGMADMLSDVMHKVAQTMDVPRINLDAIVSGGTNAEPRPSLSQPTSILVLGRPGLGKTTLLRDIARVLADKYELAVVVVDSSLEIGGAAAVPHPALGAARRMEVRDRFSQQDVLIEAVQNHAPQVVVIDEIGTAKEVEAVKTIAQRGVAMVATAHGTDLMSIISNPVLAPCLVASRAKPSEIKLLRN